MTDSTPTLASLLAASPRHLPALEIHATLELLDAAIQAYRAELRRRPSHCQEPPPKRPASSQGATPLLSLPPEIVARALSLLEAPSLALCLRLSSAFLRCDEQQQPGQGPPQGLVEQALRLRAAEAGRTLPETLPADGASWVQHLLWREVCGPQQLPTVAAEHSHTLFVDAERRLLSCGSKDDDEGVCAAALGHGEGVDEVAVPTPIPALQGVRISTVAASMHISLAVSEAGRLYSWGEGSLGHGANDEEEEELFTPTPIAALSAVRVHSVAAGASHCLAVTSTGALYSWGGGGYGSLGHGDFEPRRLPTRVEGLQERVHSVAAGSGHSLAITTSGALYSWGAGAEGQLGHGDGQNRHQPTRVEGLPAPICAAAAGTSHSVAIASDGRSWGWGYGEDATLGLQLTDHQLTPQEYPELRVAHSLA